MRRGLLVVLVTSLLAAAAGVQSRGQQQQTSAMGGLREAGWREAVDRRYPEEVVFVTAVDKDGNPNIMTMGWTTVASTDPVMIAISVGKARYTHKLISQTREFVYCIPGEDLTTQALYCGSHTGRTTDKFKETGLTPVKAKIVKPPLIRECIANVECQVVGELDAGDHTVFLGKVVAAWISDDKTHLKRLFNLGARKLVPLL